MSAGIRALSPEEVQEIRQAMLFLEVEPTANIPLSFLLFESGKLSEALKDYEGCADEEDQGKRKMMRARVLVHLRRLQATANDLLPPKDQLPF